VNIERPLVGVVGARNEGRKPRLLASFRRNEQTQRPREDRPGNARSGSKRGTHIAQESSAQVVDGNQSYASGVHVSRSFVTSARRQAVRVRTRVFLYPRLSSAPHNSIGVPAPRTGRFQPLGSWHSRRGDTQCSCLMSPKKLFPLIVAFTLPLRSSSSLMWDLTLAFPANSKRDDLPLGSLD
jgi:hypothetical protein